MPRARRFTDQRHLGLDVVALTFDDGPSEWTEPILDTLRETDVRATFFVVGESIEGREATLARIAAEGHEVGNHTLTHPRLSELSREEVRTELVECNRRVERVLGEAPRVFRPPYFQTSPAVFKAAGECGFRWSVEASVWADDWELASSEAIVAEILKQVAPGSTVLMHDGCPPRAPTSRPDRKPTADAVSALVPELVARGFRFLTVSELIALRPRRPIVPALRARAARAWRRRVASAGAP